MVERERLVEIILELEPELFRAMGPVQPSPWVDVDLNMSQLKVLMTLSWVEPEDDVGGLRMSDLAHRLGVTPATVTTVVDRLEERNIVERQNDPQDRRQHRCRLTPIGQAMIRRICESARLRTRNLLAALSESELETVRAAMELLIGAASLRATKPATAGSV